MTTTVEGKASDDRKPRRKGAVRGSITVSGKAYGEYRVTLVPNQHPAKAHKDWSQDSLPLQDDRLPDGGGRCSGKAVPVDAIENSPPGQGLRESTHLEFMKDGNRNQGGPIMRDNCLRTTKNQAVWRRYAEVGLQ